MKTALLIAHAFPPTNLTDSRRAAAFAKYLPCHGWDVRVLTAPPMPGQPQMSQEETRQSTGMDDGRVRRVAAPPCKRGNWLSRKVTLLGFWWMLPGGAQRCWAERALAAADGFCRDVDVVWATAPFYGPLWVGRHLRRMFGTPWVADFRDIPEQFVQWPPLLRRLTAWRGAQLCRTAAHVTTVSRPLADTLALRHRVPVTVIPNGYNPEWLCEQPGTPDPGVFRIIYTGSVWGPQDPRPVLQAVNELISAGAIPEESVEVVFYGASRQSVVPSRPSPFDRVVRVEPALPLRDILRVQRQATVLLVLGWPGADGVLTTKLFEYMAAGRPVLAYPRDPNGIDGVLQATGIGRSCNSVAELKSVIAGWYREWERGRDIALNRNLGEIKKYSRSKQAGILADRLGSVVYTTHGAM